MAEDALKRFNGKTKPYYQRPFKINWGSNKKNTATAMAQESNQNNQQTNYETNLTNFLTPNSLNLLSQKNGHMNDNQRLQAATLKALGLSSSAQYQPTPPVMSGGSINQAKPNPPINPVTYNPENPTSIYVGDLDQKCDNIMLEEIFKCRFSTVVGAKIIKDPSTRMSKGYGFVMFASPEEAERAITEMHGFQILGRKIRTGKSILKSTTMIHPQAPVPPTLPPPSNARNALATQAGEAGRWTTRDNNNQSNDNNLQVQQGGPGPKEPPAKTGNDNLGYNEGYSQMRMFGDQMGYPVKFSQYYNFNMINMPLQSLGQGYPNEFNKLGTGIQPTPPSSVNPQASDPLPLYNNPNYPKDEQVNKNLTTDAHNSVKLNQRVSQGTHDARFYTDQDITQNNMNMGYYGMGMAGYSQMGYVYPGQMMMPQQNYYHPAQIPNPRQHEVNLAMNQNQAGAHLANPMHHNSVYLAKRSSEAMGFLSNQVQQPLKKINPGNQISRRVSEDNRDFKNKKLSDQSGWFLKEKGVTQVKDLVDQMSSSKLDWFSTPQNSCNKFVIEFFEL